MFFLVFLNCCHLCLLISAVIAQVFNPTVELVIPRAIQIKETTAEIKNASSNRRS